MTVAMSTMPGQTTSHGLRTTPCSGAAGAVLVGVAVVVLIG